MKQKTNSTFLFLLAFGFLFFSNDSFGQTEKEKIDILNQYDLEKIKALKNKIEEKAKREKELLVKLAAENNWPVYKTKPDGSFDQLVGVFPDGSPKYYSIENIDAARSTRTNHLHSDGSLGLNLNGQNMTGGVWDGGPARASHQEFGGRLIVGDGVLTLNGNSFHATHVSGTVGASGVQPNAKGMAHQATIKTFNWEDDELEVLSEIENGLLLSNHSYGTPISNVPGDWYMGAYAPDARAWDEIHYVSPYYLMVVSAGNDGNNTNASPTTSGFDKLNGNKNCKNNLVIANAQDANVSTSGTLVSVLINSASSQGPSDDFRIKPDITGNGTGVYSCNSGSNTSYTTLSGTSMSGPNVMGTLLLLQQHQNNLYQNFLRGATLKALACHTADDAGRPGPDANFGWGLLNAKEAATTISNNGLNTWISEESLKQGQTYSMTLKSTANTPLIATISWTDVPGIANTGLLNDPTPVLINDLDIRITQGNSVFFPWKLSSNALQNASRLSDNNVDTVESIKIDNPNGGDYTITVTHKGNLVEGFQNFGLVVSGITSSFGIVPLGYNQVKCATENAVFDFNLKKTSGNAVSFSTADLPNGAVATFSAPSLNTSGNFSMTVSNLANITPGEYTIGIIGTNGTETERRNVVLKVFNNQFSPINVIAPISGQTGVSSSVVLQWQKDNNAESYTVQVATNVTFANIIRTSTTTSTNVAISDLADQTIYYWRVLPSNRCGSAATSNSSSFQTGILNCGLSFTATDFSDAIIDDIPNSLASVPIVITDNFEIGDINVNLNISHTWVQDMKIYLDGPASIGSPRIALFEEPCGGEDDINATLDDAGTSLVCAVNPAISGTIIPKENLSSLNGQLATGTWTLQIIDSYNNDGGSINAFSLDFCNITPIENNLVFVNNGVIALTSSTKTILNTEINASTTAQNSNAQIYTIVQLPELGQLKRNTATLAVGNTFSQNDIDLNRISYSNNQTNPATDSFVVNILNTSAGWLPNRVIPITIVSQLNTNEISLDKIKIYPNPARNFVTIEFPSTLLNATQMTLFDIQGRVIFSKESTTLEEQISVDSLQEGVYMLSLENGNQKTIRKVVVSRK